MANLETPLIWIALSCLVLALIFSIWRLAVVKAPAAETSGGQTVSLTSNYRLPTYLILTMIIAGILSITLSLIARTTVTGHGPFSNMYEFSVSFTWGILIMSLFFWLRYKMLILSFIGIIVASGLLIFALKQPSQVIPLVPALQQSWLLTTHVASAVIAYGAFTIGFGAAIVYLIRSNRQDNDIENLDNISYTTVKVGFPFMTLVIVLGALWADVAWGSYWSWDPKETASLVTWLLYAAYLHARVIRGWRGRRAAILLIMGFVAVIFTFFGNYIFVGLHSYG